MLNESVVTHQFKKGQTVAVLKGFLADELELNPADLQLRLEDRVMLDPLSLTDFDTITQASSIDVEVRICSSNNTQQHRK
ncbi:TPA: hypothetical protein N0F65_003964 [Lagenidium giganteum]|uniref:Ubiquitin-like domain-containing protein n=1 Tax=Lagenidium giganteum TaxID=4803 RepID=A0AAV2YVC5_9STRA|nr:TPA: hypothetical protein N0F65_003964 [Lagenidium giganteum]